MTWTCDNDDPNYPGCEATFENFLIDGYAVGDRLLEGVRFKCWKGTRWNPEDGNSEEVWETVVHADDAGYFSQFNEQMWYKKIREHLEELDMATCPICKDNDFLVNE